MILLYTSECKIMVEKTKRTVIVRAGARNYGRQCQQTNRWLCLITEYFNCDVQIKLTLQLAWSLKWMIT